MNTTPRVQKPHVLKGHPFKILTSARPHTPHTHRKPPFLGLCAFRSSHAQTSDTHAYSPLLHDREHVIHTVLCLPLFFLFFLLKHVPGGSFLIPSHSCRVSPVWIPALPRPPALMTQGTAVPLRPFAWRPCRTCSPERGLQWRVPSPGPHCRLPGAAGPHGPGLLLLTARRPALGRFLSGPSDLQGPLASGGPTRHHLRASVTLGGSKTVTPGAALCCRTVCVVCELWSLPGAQGRGGGGFGAGTPVHLHEIQAGPSPILSETLVHTGLKLNSRLHPTCP